MAGLAVIDGDNLYHYKDCGLDYIWLGKGVEYKETAFGQMVKVPNRDELHAVIARAIVTSPNRLRGQEVRFLRSMLGLSQEAFGRLVRQTRVTIARWEGQKEKPIPTGSDDWLRIVYAKRTEGDKIVCELVKLLTELDELRDTQPGIRSAQFSTNEQSAWRLAS